VTEIATTAFETAGAGRYPSVDRRVLERRSSDCFLTPEAVADLDDQIGGGRCRDGTSGRYANL